MLDVCVEIPLQPSGAKRPRVRVLPAVPEHVARVKGISPRMKPIAVVYKPKSTEKWQQAFADALDRFMPSTRIEAPIRVDWNAVTKRPKSRLKEGTALIWQPTKPDRDNVDKNVMDALRRFLKDDTQIVFGLIMCTFAPPGAESCIVIRIRSASAFDPNTVARQLGILPQCCETGIGSQGALKLIEPRWSAERSRRMHQDELNAFVEHAFPPELDSYDPWEE